MTNCVVDDQPADGAQLCSGCVDQLAMRLREVPGLVDELEVTITRQAKLGARGGGGGSSSEPPLPFDVGASNARGHLRDILGGWCRDVAERSGERLPSSVDRDTLSDASSWLLGHLRAVAHHPAAGDLYDEVTDAIWQAVRTIDRPADTVFAGWCCTALYAPEGRSMASCRECGQAYAVDDARRMLLGQLEGRRATAAEASRILGALGVRITPARIRLWAHRGKVAADAARTYRLGDLVTVASNVSPVSVHS